MAKVVKNLTLDPEAVERGERFSRKRGTTVSRIVSDFLSGLPDESDDALAPAVGRLLGIAKGKGDERAYHRYLEQKYLR